MRRCCGRIRIRADLHYRRAVARNPELPVAQLNLAGALARLGRTEEAAAVYEEMLRAHPDSFRSELPARGGTESRASRRTVEPGWSLGAAWTDRRSGGGL